MKGLLFAKNSDFQAELFNLFEDIGAKFFDIRNFFDDLSVFDELFVCFRQVSATHGALLRRLPF